MICSVSNLLAVAAITLTSVVALPTGAPKCKINETVITGGHGSQQGLGYAFHVTPITENNATHYEIAITNPEAGSSASISGILLYLTSTSAPVNQHIGAFSLSPSQSTKWKYQTAESCSASKIIQDPKATLTHATGDSVPLKNAVFKWYPKPNEVPILSTVFVNAVVSGPSLPSPISGMRKRATVVPAWQHFPVTPLVVPPVDFVAPGTAIPGSMEPVADKSSVVDTSNTTDPSTNTTSASPSSTVPESLPIAAPKNPAPENRPWNSIIDQGHEGTSGQIEQGPAESIPIAAPMSPAPDNRPLEEPSEQISRKNHRRKGPVYIAALEDDLDLDDQ